MMKVQGVLRGFTLIESLVVMVIIIIMAAFLLFPVFIKALGKARQPTTINSLQMMNISRSQVFFW